MSDYILNTARTASDSTDWKHDMERIEASTRMPVVYSYRDRRGTWKIKDDRPTELT